MMLDYADCVEEDCRKVKGKQREPLCLYFQDHDLVGSISTIMKAVETLIVEASRKIYPGLPAPNEQALRNLRGSWFELIVKYVAWSVASESGNLWVVPMPNASVIQVWGLFNQNVKTVLDSLFSELEQKGSRMSLSNPDILFINPRKTGVDKYSLASPPSGFTLTNLALLDKAYNELRDKCEYDAIAFGVAVKTALRPDRRYQIVYEGAALKAIISHIKQRFWDRNYDIAYYGLVNTPPTARDVEVLTNPSIDSLTSVYVEPRKSVDAIENCDTIERLREIISSWLD